MLSRFGIQYARSQVLQVPSATFNLTFTARKIKFTWKVFVKRTQDGTVLNPWSATKTVWIDP
jgi:hypothetical protein